MNQNNHELPDWMRAALRNAATRKGLILDGHVRDIFYDPERRDYVDLPTLLIRHLIPLGFSIASQWDQVDGLRFADNRMIVRWQEAMRQGNRDRSQAPPEGRPYDAGEDTAPNPEPTAGLAIGPGELFPAIRRALIASNERPLFILTWNHYLLGDPAHMDPEERNCMLHLGKALCGEPIVAMDSDHLRRTDGLVILITTNIARLDHLLYQDEQRIATATVPRPARPERHAFFVRHADDLRCERPKSASTVSVADNRQTLADTLADLTDGCTRVDLQQILSLSMQTEATLAPEKLINQYLHGDSRSPWQDLSEDKLEQVDDILRQRVIGQNGAVTEIGTVLIRAKMGLAGLQHSGQGNSPKGKIFCVGPTGVGKTELAKATAEFVFGDERAIIRFDMAEFADEHSRARLIGAPPGYVGYEQGGELTRALRERPFSVVIFDEIEKAHPEILTVFLGILEDGRLTDGRGETVHFHESLLVFTSNLGAASAPETDDLDINRAHYLEAVRQHFVSTLGRPELLNRLGDNIIVFNPINQPALRRSIVDRKLRPVRQHLQERFGVELRVSDALADHFADSARREHGGRGVVNAMEQGLLNPLARFLFAHRHQLRRGRVIHADLANGQISLDLQEG